jgi:hypothetical protein
MSAYVHVVSMLSCVGSGLATGLITRPRSPANCLSDPQFQVNESDGPEGLRRKTEEVLVWILQVRSRQCCEAPY